MAAGQSYAYMLFLPFFVANAGLREHAFRLFLERLDPILNLHFQAYAIALGTAALVLIINIVIPAIGGLVWAFIDYRKRIQTRNKETIEETVII